MNKIDTIVLTSIDSHGANYEAAGTWKNRAFRIEIHCEYDGRDVESTSQLVGGYNPMNDPGEFFFNEVFCEDKRFIELHNKGYAAWELFPQQ
jgi:hypothetical protein